MNGGPGENIEPVAFTDDEAILVPMPAQDIKTMSTSTLSGSYTTAGNILIVAVELSNGTPTLQDLRNLDFNAVVPINTSEMATFLNVDKVATASQKAPVSSPDEAIQVTEKDDEYYLSMVNFQFEEMEFSVPQWGFTKRSEQSTLVLPPDKGTCEIVGDDVSVGDFRNLMEFMYPLDPLHSSQSQLSERCCVSVLKLTSKWHMTHCRKQALVRLETDHCLTAEEKVILGRLCGIPKWCREGFVAFAGGDPHLKREHEASMGIDAMLKITRAREAAYRNDVVAYHQRYPGPASFAESMPSNLRVGGARGSSADSELDLVVEFCTARENHLLGLVRVCYEKLIDREESITLEEIPSLGLDTTIELWRARLQLFKRYRDIMQSAAYPDFLPYIETEFREDLEEAQLLQNTIDPRPQLPVARPSKTLKKWKKGKTPAASVWVVSS